MTQEPNLETRSADLSLDSTAVQLDLGAAPAVAALCRIRLRPVELARLLGVGKSTVTAWTKANLVRVGIDGRIDPAQAVRSLLEHHSAGRVRAMFLRELIGEFRELRAERDAAHSEAARVRSELDAMRVELAALRARCSDADSYGDSVAARLFEVTETMREALPALERADATAAARLANALATLDDGDA